MFSVPLPAPLLPSVSVPVAVVPLYFAYRAYGVHVILLDEEHRRRDGNESLGQGISVVDNDGIVTKIEAGS